MAAFTIRSGRSEEHTSESSHSQISYAVFCLKKKKKTAGMRLISLATLISKTPPPIITTLVPQRITLTIYSIQSVVTPRSTVRTDTHSVHIALAKLGRKNYTTNSKKIGQQSLRFITKRL